MNYDSFGALAAEFGKMAKRAPAASGFAVKHGAESLARAAKSKLGTYQQGWPQLKESTQRERTRLGFTANDPLFRSGQLQAAIQATSEGDTAFVGVTEGRTTLHDRDRDVDAALVMAVQEVGNERVPARPVFGTVVADDLERISDAVAIETLARIGLISEEGAPPER